jgi:hypothetical protein
MKTVCLGKRNRERVERATVRLPEKGGCGVLVPGAFIVTATHCINWSGTGGMVLGDACPTKIETATGAKFRVDVAACEPVADIAALAELDNQEWPDDADAFEQWRKQVEPVPFSTRQLRVEQSCAVFIFTHKREWIAARVTRHGLWRLTPSSSVELSVNGKSAGEGIESGMSGSPVVTADGRLYGVVSNSFGTIPVCVMALPHWVLARIGVPPMEHKPEPMPTKIARKLARARKQVARALAVTRSAKAGEKAATVPPATDAELKKLREIAGLGEDDQ